MRYQMTTAAVLAATTPNSRAGWTDGPTDRLELSDGLLSARPDRRPDVLHLRTESASATMQPVRYTQAMQIATVQAAVTIHN